MEKTIAQYQDVIAKCKNLFAQKNQDYGSAWRVLRLPSITDQIFIKAKRIRTLQETQAKVNEGIADELVGIVNYGIMALIQIRLKDHTDWQIPYDTLMGLYEEETAQNLHLLTHKNHDYAEAWRDMRVSSMTDIILMKLLRTKQIEDNAGQTVVSEGVDANYRDIINYAVFCLIQLGEISPETQK
ncbi:MAG TPA: hypothetical protein DCM08_05335 [Microscillaceae bacterium]|jgi:hypothetical protein|nr:hypothetical protein [Microscillaceae bacterium]